MSHNVLKTFSNLCWATLEAALGHGLDQPELQERGGRGCPVSSFPQGHVCAPLCHHSPPQSVSCPPAFIRLSAAKKVSLGSLGQ